MGSRWSPPSARSLSALTADIVRPDRQIGGSTVWAEPPMRFSNGSFAERSVLRHRLEVQFVMNAVGRVAMDRALNLRRSGAATAIRAATVAITLAAHVRSGDHTAMVSVVIFAGV